MIYCFLSFLPSSRDYQSLTDILNECSKNKQYVTTSNRINSKKFKSKIMRTQTNNSNNK